MFLRYIIGSDRTLLDRLAGLGDITYLFLETHIPRTNNYFKQVIIIITWNPQPFAFERRQPMGSPTLVWNFASVSRWRRHWFWIFESVICWRRHWFGNFGPSAAGDALLPRRVSAAGDDDRSQ